jgi:hypothetical protein
MVRMKLLLGKYSLHVVTLAFCFRRKTRRLIAILEVIVAPRSFG